VDHDTGERWHQLNIHFADQPDAEQAAVIHLEPQLRQAEDHGVLAAWFFIRKAGWWRLRYQPGAGSSGREATANIAQALSCLCAQGHINCSIVIAVRS
jgi:thiopeptide-type bacteriocin biosynthesis protein